MKTSLKYGWLHGIIVALPNSVIMSSISPASALLMFHYISA